MFARNRALIERIFNAFRDIVYMENEDSNGLLVYSFLFCTPLKIILTMTVFVRTPRQYNQAKLSLLNFAEFIRKLRLGYGANGVQSAITRVKSMRAILKSYRFYCVMCLRLFSQLSAKNTFSDFYDVRCDACGIEMNYFLPLLSYENLILSLAHSAFSYPTNTH